MANQKKKITNKNKGKVVVHEMRIHSPDGEHLYLNKDERRKFLEASKEESPTDRMFCTILHFSGCRPSEALALSPTNIKLLSEDKPIITFKTLKKRKLNNKGEIKHDEFRDVPVPYHVYDQLDLVFGIRSEKNKELLLWSKESGSPLSRASAYRMVKRVMSRAGIEGKKATSKGLRHGFGIAMVMKGVDLHIVSKLLGHSDSSTTEIYTTAIEDEKHDIVMGAWEE